MRTDNRYVQSAKREGYDAERELRAASWRHHTDRVAEVMLAGLVAGGLTGAIAGPVGIVVGAVIGGIVGALAGGTMDDQDVRDRFRHGELDRTIGVTGGDIGAASPSQPPSRRSFVSFASAGIGGVGASGGSRQGEGPISPPAE